MRKVADVCLDLGKVVKESRDLIEKANTENRAFTAEEESSYQAMDTRINALETEKKRIEKQEERERGLATPRNQPIAPPSLPGHETEEERDNPIATAEYRRAFSKFMTHGLQGMNSDERSALAAGSGAKDGFRVPHVKRSQFPTVAERRDYERRALSMGIAGAGGETVPVQEFVPELIKKVDDLVPIREAARTFTAPNAQSLGAPYLSADPDDADWTTELETGSEDSAMATGKRELVPYPLAKLLKVSKKLLRANMVGIEGVVRDRLAYKVAIPQSAAFNTGSGSNRPLGVYTASANGVATTQDVNVGDGAAGIDVDKFIDARYGSFRQGYWANGKWQFSPTVLANIRKKRGTSSDYLWQPGLAGGIPSTFLDLPYMIDPNAPATITTGAYVAILADWNYYWIVDALTTEIQRLDELYAATNQVGFIVRAEVDAMPVMADAFIRCKITA